MLEAAVTFIGTAVLAIVGWAFQTSSKVAVITAQREDLILLLNTRFGEINRRLERIERSLHGYKD